MTRLTYDIMDTAKTVIITGIETYDEAKYLAKKYDAQIKEHYTPIREAKPPKKNHKISEEWLARHPEMR